MMSCIGKTNSSSKLLENETNYWRGPLMSINSSRTSTTEIPSIQKVNLFNKTFVRPITGSSSTGIFNLEKEILRALSKSNVPVCLDSVKFGIKNLTDCNNLFTSKEPLVAQEYDSFGNPLWCQMTIIYCLESDMSENDVMSGQGSLYVYNTSQTFQRLWNGLIPYRDDEFDMSINQKKMDLHQFLDPCIPGNFVIFPSDTLHKLKPINGRFHIKRLHMNFWVKQLLERKYNFPVRNITNNRFLDYVIGNDICNLYQHLELHPHVCSCNACQPLKYRDDVRFRNHCKIINHLLQKTILSNDIITHVIQFLEAPKHQSVTLVHRLYPGYYCTCSKCYTKNWTDPELNNYPYEEEEEEEEEYDPYDGYGDY